MGATTGALGQRAAIDPPTWGQPPNHKGAQSFRTWVIMRCPRHGLPLRRCLADTRKEETAMERIDWSALSGPRVSRRTMMKLAAASGAGGFAGWLSARGRTMATGRGVARAA